MSSLALEQLGHVLQLGCPGTAELWGSLLAAWHHWDLWATEPSGCPSWVCCCLTWQGWAAGPGAQSTAAAVADPGHLDACGQGSCLPPTTLTGPPAPVPVSTGRPFLAWPSPSYSQTWSQASGASPEALPREGGGLWATSGSPSDPQQPWAPLHTLRLLCSPKPLLCHTDAPCARSWHRAAVQ